MANFIIRSNNTHEQAGFSWLIHNGGEVHINLPDDQQFITNEITAYLYNSDEVMVLLNLVDAIRNREPKAFIQVNVMYFPYARADRPMPGGGGDAVGVRVMAELLKQLRLDDIRVLDPHSSAVTLLLPEARIITQADIWTPFLKGLTNTLLIAPDEGAVPKLRELSKATGIPMVAFKKRRDPSTGKIMGVEAPDTDLSKYHRLYVVDDICDGGATFIEVAKLLPENNLNQLLITHGIFSGIAQQRLPRYYHLIRYVHSFREIESPDFVKQEIQL